MFLIICALLGTYIPKRFYYFTCIIKPVHLSKIITELKT